MLEITLIGKAIPYWLVLTLHIATFFCSKLSENMVPHQLAGCFKDGDCFVYLYHIDDISQSMESE